MFAAASWRNWACKPRQASRSRTQCMTMARDNPCSGCATLCDALDHPYDRMTRRKSAAAPCLRFCHAFPIFGRRFGACPLLAAVIGSPPQCNQPNSLTALLCTLHLRHQPEVVHGPTQLLQSLNGCRSAEGACPNQLLTTRKRRELQDRQRASHTPGARHTRRAPLPVPPQPGSGSFMHSGAPG